MKTNSGKIILKQVLLQEKGYKQYSKSVKHTPKKSFQNSPRDLFLFLHEQIISNQNPSSTMKKFVEEIGSPVLTSRRIQNSIGKIQTFKT